MGAISAQRALSIEFLPSDDIAGKTIDAKGAMVGAQQATEYNMILILHVLVPLYAFAQRPSLGAAHAY